MKRAAVSVLGKCFCSLKSGQVNRCQYVSGMAAHLEERNTAYLTFIFIYPPDGPFQSFGKPTFKTVIPYMSGHSCARPTAKWTGMCRLSRAWRTACGPIHLHLPTLPDLSQHHHPGLSPGVQLASAEWIDTLTSPREVCASVCVHAWEGEVKEGGMGGVSPRHK